MPHPLRPSFRTYLGLFLVALTTLTHQILLTRICSVTSWYHFAFVAVSIAMFGMTVGAVIVFVRPDLFGPDKVKRQLARVSRPTSWEPRSGASSSCTCCR